MNLRRKGVAEGLLDWPRKSVIFKEVDRGGIPAGEKGSAEGVGTAFKNKILQKEKSDQEGNGADERALPRKGACSALRRL